VIRSASKHTMATSLQVHGEDASAGTMGNGYFRIRDFEYAQPLYDLAFLLEVEALAKGSEVPKYRTYSLWRAGYSLDGYGSTIDRWLDGTAPDAALDYVPSSRIRQYLANIARTGTIPELRSYRNEKFDRCLRLRAVRGLGPSKIALTVSSQSLPNDWFKPDQADFLSNRERMTKLYEGQSRGPWQTAHVVPPLLRFLHAIQEFSVEPLGWDVLGVSDPFSPVTLPVEVRTNGNWDSIAIAIGNALKREKLFRREPTQTAGRTHIIHQMGWGFTVGSGLHLQRYHNIDELAQSLDPLAYALSNTLRSDLHLHTAWSDGSAPVNLMAEAVTANGLEYFAVTDHSRSEKLQGGLTPPLWLRQANALTLVTSVCPVLHGIEVDILKDGRLDLPPSLLAAADLVVASVHSNWTDDVRANTARLLRAIETGYIDVIAHPTSAIVGKPGVPDYVRPAADVNWDEVFEKCALWNVALELNCFPSRLDLPLHLLRRGADAGCAVSVGSDAHARSHLLNLRFGAAGLERVKAPVVLNRLDYLGLKQWVTDSRAKRRTVVSSSPSFMQLSLGLRESDRPQVSLRARIQPPRDVPSGSSVMGIDLTAGDKATGIALLNGCSVETCSLFSDEEILAFIEEHEPRIVSIDSPLGLPGGGDSINPKAGIMRVAEHDLASIGIPAYPSLIDSMENLTLRGIHLRGTIERLPRAPRVIESYPGAAQDILCIPRKQRSLDLLRDGLRRLGLTGPGLDTRSHDEMDAITSAVVGRYFEAGLFEPMGIVREAQLVVPKIRPVVFETNPVVCLAGKTGAGKSVVARYLSVFYGFQWIRTRDIIRDLLVEDTAKPPARRLLARSIDAERITETHLREFGALILEECKQVPLRRRLTKIVRSFDAPVVVDSIRDAGDLKRDDLDHRPVLIWFVECEGALMASRLAKRAKPWEDRGTRGSPVDRTSSMLRHAADSVVSNNGSLEDLRWQVDDTLFARLGLCD
jgi:histidinol phosphatase-like PHP family hydrolase/predicted nuclease with RNAse H fold/dephospho-CoA kinase